MIPRLQKAEHQPPVVEFYTNDSVFIKQMYIENANTYIAQHSHKYSHHSMLASGSVRVWKDDKHFGDFTAPTAIPIDAAVKHMFMSLEDKTLVYCIHNISRTGEVEVLEENDLGV